ncbi:MAG: diacylglycerol kinase family protein [Ferruginibacter sp.]
MARLTRSFVYAFNGIWLCIFKEANFKIHILVSVIAIIMGAIFNISNIEWVIIIGCIVFVLSMEMINTAIEQLCNVVHKEEHPGIKATKDIAAGAVLVSAFGAFLTGSIIFFPKILSFIQTT